MDDLNDFTDWLVKHTVRKDELYDGVQKARELDTVLRFAIEELGEVSGAITRERWNLAEAECIDLAHCAFLIFRVIRQTYLNA